MHALNILIVDDERDLLELLRRSFVLSGATVRIAENGFEGLNKIREAQPDVVLTDMRMPGGDGKHLIRRVHEEFPDVIIIAMTGHATISESDAVRLGAKTLIRKPFDMGKLAADLVKLVS